MGTFCSSSKSRGREEEEEEEGKGGEGRFSRIYEMQVWQDSSAKL